MHSSNAIIDQVRQQIYTQSSAQGTCARDLYWIEQFLHFHAQVPTAMLDQSHLSSFLSYLGSLRYLSPINQLQAASALVFLFRSHLKRSLHGLQLHVLAPQKIPVQHLHAVI